MRDISELHVPVTTETKTTIGDSVKPQSILIDSFIHFFISSLQRLQWNMWLKYTILQQLIISNIYSI